jgi:hypothetical protein
LVGDKTMKVKTLTIRQPYAELMAQGIKKFETRGWITKYRGIVCIHSGLSNLKSQQHTLDSLHERFPITQAIKQEKLIYGHVLAVAQLTEVKFIGPLLQVQQSELEQAVGYWAVKGYAWKLDNIVKLSTPFPYKGMQGLFDLVVPSSYIDFFINYERSLKGCG